MLWQYCATMNVPSSPPASFDHQPGPRASAAAHILFIDEPVPVPFRHALRRRHDAVIRARTDLRSSASANDRPEASRAD
jgi:hypothetical protein